MTGPLIERLPAVRGDYGEAVPMARHTWFGVGGPADIIFSPADAADLGAFLAACPAEIPVLPVGAGDITGWAARLPKEMDALREAGS